MRLSKRLQTIANMIPDGVRVIDVGCDHAFLDIYLTLQGTSECIASDRNENVLKKTREMIENYHLSDKIQVIKSDGLKEIKLKDNDFVVIAGMGTSTILKIVKEKKPTQMIVQSNNNLEELRRELSKKYGFLIVDEQIVLEKNIYYVIIKFQVGITCYSEKECLFGPVLTSKKDRLTQNYFQHLLEKKKSILSKISNRSEKQKKIMKEIAYLEELLNQ